MQKVIFKKKVSKGSRFNQIYIPKYLENDIQVGDEVEVRLIKKQVNLYYSKELKQLSDFKEKLIKDVFSLINSKGISDVFIVGSFLFKKVDYKDIDIVIITKKTTKDESIYNQLVDKFNLKFHVISIEKERFEYLLKSCPLTRTMFNQYISNKKTELNKEKTIDKKHLKFLLMMPEDLLEIRLNNRVFYDNLRRLITIENFLDNKEFDLESINKELKKLTGDNLYERMQNNEEVDESKIKDIREIIKTKLKKIREKL